VTAILPLCKLLNRSRQAFTCIFIQYIHNVFDFHE
jgi:hypothetical protein